MTRSTVGLQVNRVVLITLLCACVASTLVPLAQASGQRRAPAANCYAWTPMPKLSPSSRTRERKWISITRIRLSWWEVRGVQGLSSKTGSKLEVFYTEAEGKFQAVRIEIKS